MRKVLLTLFLVFASWQASFAQSTLTKNLSTFPINPIGSIPVRNIGIKEGLSNGFVDDMVIDGQGFVWVATEWGLNRIAGNKCTVFYPSNSGISNNEHVGLFYHPQSNTVWVHSKDGRADIFDCKTQTFSHFEIEGKVVFSIADICMAADSTIWLADYNGDIHHYNPLTKEYYRIDKKLLPGFANGVRSITDDGKGNLYIGLRMEGMIIYNTHTKRSRYFRSNPADPTSLPGDNVRSVFIDHLQNIWVGTNKGLALFDSAKGIFRVFKHQKGDSHGLAGDNIIQIMETPDNTLWIASDIGGISKLDLNQYNHPNYGNVSFTQMTKENYGLSSNNIRKVMQDAYGNLWIANFSTGVDFIPSTTSSFMTLTFLGEPILNVSALFNDSKDNLWIGQDNKISEYRQGAIVHQWDFSQYISNSSSSIYLFREDKQGNIWFGTSDNGVLMLNPTTGSFTRFESTKDLDANALYIDKTGKVWVGTEDGVYTIYNKVEKKENAINDIMGQSAIPFSILEDDYGQLWIGTLARGIYVFDKNKKLVTHLINSPFPSSSINQLIKDEDGGIWAATHTGLVYIPNPQKPNEFKVYGEEQGISDNHIRSLVQDRQGNIWVSMFSGIACFDRNKQKFYNYDYQSGIPMGNFGVGSAVISSTGIVYFGSPGGICSFNPQLLTEQKDVPNVQIIDCEQIVSTTEKLHNVIVPLDKDGVAHLKYDENTFKITFTSSNFAQEGNVEYSYLMKGLDDKWFETEGDGEVTFRNLSPGEYTFQVRAKLKNQEWKNAKIAEMKVVVEPPLWLTWWAKLIYVLIVGGIGFYFFRSYKNELQLRNSLEKTKWEAQQKQELNEERLRFFTNITHELRTPLTLIMGPLEDLMADSRLPEVLSKKVKSIHASSERLLNLINEILEFRKTETQNRRLTVAHSDIKAFVKEIGDRFKDLNRNPQVSFHVNMPEQQSVDIYFDSEVISTVLNNLMSNAIKYTPKGNIDLTLSCIQGKSGIGDDKEDLKKVSISVKDSGYGISKSAIPHIFDRYYQAKGLHQASGTGIGLALVKSLAKLHEAELTVESEEGKGTEFCFILDANNTYPNALHKEDKPANAEELLLAKDKSNATEEEKEQTDVRPLLLIVEDNDDIRQYVNESLCEDYRIIEARNGKEGRDLAFNQTPDLIMSDIMMPEMDGIEMMKILKNDIRTSHIPVILLTAKTTPNDQEEGYNSGADSYLMKPFSASLLHSRIRNILSGRRRLAEYLLSHKLPESNSTSAETEENVDTSVPELSPLDQKFMDKLNRLIDENMTTIDIDIAFMTDKMAMSHSSFYRKVKALTGVSANEYIRKVKLQRSMQLLQEGENNVTEVAMLTGFNNIGYFRKCFKKEYGISPSDVLKGKG